MKKDYLFWIYPLVYVGLVVVAIKWNENTGPSGVIRSGSSEKNIISNAETGSGTIDFKNLKRNDHFDGPGFVYLTGNNKIPDTNAGIEAKATKDPPEENGIVYQDLQTGINAGKQIYLDWSTHSFYNWHQRLYRLHPETIQIIPDSLFALRIPVETMVSR